MKETFKGFWKSKKHRIMTIVFILVFVLNVLTPYISDDFLYAIKDSFFDIFHREVVQYMTWTGRSIAHIIDRTFLSMPKMIFNLCNSLCFVYLIHLICEHITQDKDDWKLYLGVTCFVFLFVPFFGQTVLWETGSCNYLWMMVIVLGFLKVFHFNQTVNPILMFVFGIIAGWTNENTAGAMVLLLFYFVWSRKECRNLSHYLGIVGALIGLVIMVIAPGNAIRGSDFVQTNGKVYELLHDFFGSLEVLETGEWILLILVVIGIALNITYKKPIKDALAFALAGIAAVFAIILSPVPVLFDRSMFGSVIFLIIAFGILFTQLKKESFYPTLLNIGLAFLLLFSSLNYLKALPDIFYTKYLDSKREAYIHEQKQLGNLNPIVPQIHHEFETTYNPIYGLSDLSIYRRQWMNESYSTVNGLESIQSTPMSKFNTIYKNADPELLNITDYSDYLSKIFDKENIVTFVCSSRLNVKEYDELIKQLALFGENRIVVSNTIYISGMIENGMVKESLYSEVPIEKSYDINGHYVYMNSEDDPVHCDILIDNIEYTNDQAGITFVVYDTQKNCVLDSITFKSESDQGGIRYYIEP